MEKSLPANDRATLRRILNSHTNMSELKNLAFDLGFDDLLDCNSKADFPRELILKSEQKGKMKELLVEIRRMLPTYHNELLQLLEQLSKEEQSKNESLLLHCKQSF